MSDAPRLDAADLRRLAAEAAQQADCACAALVCAGWEALPSAFDVRGLERLGALGPELPYGVESSLEEHHPAGTSYWSPEAPVALEHFPYNRSELWRCRHCRRPFLRYTEYGGYYVEPRIRALDARLIVDG